MRDVNSHNFGLLIAYVVPGFIALWGIGCFSPTVRAWLGGVPQTAPTISGFLFGTLAAVAAGLVVNAIRWHVIDPLHYATGVPRKDWDYSRLPRQVEAFQYLVTNQFRYYEGYTNSMIASALTFAALAATSMSVTFEVVAAFLLLQLVLWNASRRTLVNYHERIQSFLGIDDAAPEADVPKRIDPKTRTWYVRRIVIHRPHRTKSFEHHRRSPSPNGRSH